MPKYGVQLIDGGGATFLHDNLPAAVNGATDSSFIRVIILDGDAENDAYVRRDRIAAYAKLEDENA